MLEKITRVIFGLICHQDPVKLLEVGGRDILLCPRCMGLNLGFIVAFTAVVLFIRKRIALRHGSTRILLAISVGALAIDWGLGSHPGLYNATSFSRMATGLACGTAAGIFVQYYRRSLSSRSQNSALDITAVQVAGLICLSFCIGAALVLPGSWAFISLTLLVIVLANTAIALHTLFLIVKVRLFHQEKTSD